MDLYLLNAIFSLICVVCVKGFAPSQQTASKRNYERRSSSSTLPMSNIFDDMGKFFDGLGKTKEVEPDFEVPPVEDVDGEYVGSKRIITIPGMFRNSILMLSCCLYHNHSIIYHYNATNAPGYETLSSQNNEDRRTSIILQSVLNGITEYT